MPTLICDLRPDADVWVHEYHALREAGEAVALYWPAVSGAAQARGGDDVAVEPVGSAAQLEEAFDNERLARLSGAGLPDWLPWDEFHRVLLCTNAPADLPLSSAEADLVAALFDAGAEVVEVISGQAARELAQSWHSGRRAGARVLQPPPATHS